VVFQDVAHILTEQFRSDEVYMHLFTFVLVHNSNPSRQQFYYRTNSGVRIHTCRNSQNSHPILARYEPYLQTSGLILFLQRQN